MEFSSRNVCASVKPKQSQSQNKPKALTNATNTMPHTLDNSTIGVRLEWTDFAFVFSVLPFVAFLLYVLWPLYYMPFPFLVRQFFSHFKFDSSMLCADGFCLIEKPISGWTLCIITIMVNVYRRPQHAHVLQVLIKQSKPKRYEMYHQEW